MGFLRKLGRKIKKGVKKLFSSKLGGMIGMMALNFIIPTAGNMLFKGNPIYERMVTGINNFKTNVKNVFKTPSEAIENVSPVVEDAISPVTTSEKGRIQGANVMDVIKENAKTEVSSEASKGLIKTAVDNTKEFVINLPEKIMDAPGQAVDYFKEGDFVPDAIDSAIKTSLVNAMQGDPEEYFQSKGVANTPQVEQAQGNYIRDISDSFRMATGYNPNSMEQIVQSTLYGTGAPQSMMYTPQPFAAPTVNIGK